MTGPMLTELREGILGLLSEVPLSEAEICRAYPETSPAFISSLLCQLAARGQIRIAHGTDAKKWTTTRTKGAA